MLNSIAVKNISNLNLRAEIGERRAEASNIKLQKFQVTSSFLNCSAEVIQCTVDSAGDL